LKTIPEILMKVDANRQIDEVSNEIWQDLSAYLS